MELEDLGYTQKWITYGVLSNEVLQFQVTEFARGEDINTEHYRYETLMNWIRQKDRITDLEIEQFFELALEDPNELMTGSAASSLFVSRIIKDDQFEKIKDYYLPKFGDWTTKLIEREVLKKEILKGELDVETFQKCVIFKKKYKENFLVELILNQTKNPVFLREFTKDEYNNDIREKANLLLEGFNIISLSKKELISIGHRIVRSVGSSEEIEMLKILFDQNVPHPIGSKLFFPLKNTEKEIDKEVDMLSVKQVVEKCLRYFKNNKA